MALPSREELFRLYGMTLDEYRFQVTLNWQRMQYYLVFNVAIMGAGLGLLKLDMPGDSGRLVALVFIVGIATSLLGRGAVLRGHRYYRETVIRKTLVEDLLGLWAKVAEYRPEVGTLAVATTGGQRRGRELLQDPDAWRNQPLRAGSVVWYVGYLLLGIAVIDAISALATLM